MEQQEWLTGRFEEHRSHLRGVAYRMLGSLSEADDAVQEAWLKLSRAGAEGVENLRAWLTTVVGRVCLDMLRTRSARREEPHQEQLPDSIATGSDADPEREALTAESVGLALLVVLERLEPAERLAFVLHDMFAMPFDEIALIVGRTPAAARQLASRARRRVQGGTSASGSALAGQRKIVDAFLDALRQGDMGGLLVVLDPDVVFRAETLDGIKEIRGAKNWAQGAVAFAQSARFMQPALVDGMPGIVLAPQGRLLSVARFTIVNGKITQAETIIHPERLRHLNVSVLGE